MSPFWILYRFFPPSSCSSGRLVTCGNFFPLRYFFKNNYWPCSFCRRRHPPRPSPAPAPCKKPHLAAEKTYIWANKPLKELRKHVLLTASIPCQLDNYPIIIKAPEDLLKWEKTSAETTDMKTKRGQTGEKQRGCWRCICSLPCWWYTFYGFLYSCMCRIISAE